ncbi:MAG TPA: MFS transporter [Syntrophales bacterium]
MKKFAEHREDTFAELQLPLWKANFWFSVLWVIMFLDIADRSIMAGVLPAVKSAFQLLDAQAGLVGSIMGLTIALLSFPVAIMVDRWSRKKMIAIMVTFWSMATYATGMATGYGSLLLARLGVGAGEAGYNSAANSLISSWYPKNRRGLIFGIYNMSIPLGAAFGVIFAGYVTQKYGWHAVFGVLAIPGLLLAGLSLFMPEYKTKKIDVEEIEVKFKVTDFFRYVINTPSLLFLYLGSAACMIAATSIPLWAPTFFVRTFQLTLKEATMIVGIAGLIGFLGAPLGGFLGDYISKYTLKGRAFAMCISMILFCIFAVLAFRSTVYMHAVILYTLMGFFIFSYRSNVDASSQDLAPPYFRAMVYSFVPLFNHIVGGVPAPVITGAISDRSNLPFALQVTAIIATLLALIFFISASRFWKKDVEKIRALGTFKLDQR